MTRSRSRSSPWTRSRSSSLMASARRAVSVWASRSATRLPCSSSSSCSCTKRASSCWTSASPPVEPLLDGADLVGLILQPAAGALGFDPQFGEHRAALRSARLRSGRPVPAAASGRLRAAQPARSSPASSAAAAFRSSAVLAASRSTMLVLAGQGEAQGRHHLGLQLPVAAGLRSLTLQGVGLAADLFEDVEHARQVLLGAFELGFGQALLGLEAGDAGGFLDDRAAVLRLGAEGSGRCGPAR